MQTNKHGLRNGKRLAAHNLGVDFSFQPGTWDLKPGTRVKLVNMASRNKAQKTEFMKGDNGKTDFRIYDGMLATVLQLDISEYPTEL